MFWKLPIFECATVYKNFNMDSSIKHFQHVTPITPGPARSGLDLSGLVWPSPVRSRLDQRQGGPTTAPFLHWSSKKPPELLQQSWLDKKICISASERGCQLPAAGLAPGPTAGNQQLAAGNLQPASNLATNNQPSILPDNRIGNHRNQLNQRARLNQVTSTQGG